MPESPEQFLQKTGNYRALHAYRKAGVLYDYTFRFDANKTRHPGLVWAKVQARLEARPDKLWSLAQMERTGGESDVVGHLPARRGDLWGSPLQSGLHRSQQGGFLLQRARFSGCVEGLSTLVRSTLFILILASLGLTLIAAEQRPPNIVFLLADDLGCGDLHCYGHPYARTPNIDSLARDGTRFLQYHATGCTCCPARTGLMTSKFPATYPAYPANGGFANHVTITELLKKQGYATGHFGKWHIGPVQKAGTYGIDVIGAGEEDRGKKKKTADDRGRDAHIYDEAIKFIEQHQGGPFYVNVWGHIPHNPVNPADALVKRWSGLKVRDSDFPPQMLAKFNDVRQAGGDVDDGMRRYLAEIESLDDSVGRLLKRLDELGLSENTIVVFNSDQGADMTKAANGGLRFNQMGCNGPQRGGKHTNWEGGLDVPWIVRWPGHVPAGRTDAQSVISGADWLPTLSSITGVKINAADFDGEDASAAWLGKGTHIRTQPLFWKTSSSGSESFVRDGQWKLRHPTRKNGGDIELYDLNADPTESKNVAAQHPDIVKKLAAKVEAWVATLPKDYIKTEDKQD